MSHLLNKAVRTLTEDSQLLQHASIQLILTVVVFECCRWLNRWPAEQTHINLLITSIAQIQFTNTVQIKIRLSFTCCFSQFRYCKRSYSIIIFLFLFTYYTERKLATSKYYKQWITRHLDRAGWCIFSLGRPGTINKIHKVVVQTFLKSSSSSSSSSSWLMSNYWIHAISFHFASAFAATSCSHVTAPSSAEWSRNRSPSANLVSGQDSTMWIIVCTSPHWHLSVGVMCRLCRLAAQRPCPVWTMLNTGDWSR